MLFDLSVLIPVAGIAMVTVLCLPVARALARAIDRKSGSGGAGDPGGLRTEVEKLQVRIESLEEQGARLAELEERLDFTERLLAQQRDHAALGPGASKTG